MLGDEERLISITVGSEAYAAKPRALVIIPVLDPFEAELMVKEVF
jgi:hypothetical protein